MVGIARSKDVKKFGLHDIHRDFMTTIKELSTNGIPMKIGDENIVIKGDLINAVCDTPAAVLGGFREGSAFAVKPCRRCNGSKSEIKESFEANNFLLQDMHNHIRQCKILEDRGLTKFEFEYNSKMFGVNGRSLLCDLANFSMVSNLVPDPMHTYSEGISCHLVALFLYRWTYEFQLFTLDWLNYQIANYPCDIEDKSHKPEDISRHSTIVDMYVKQKAVAMNTLVFILPHILGPIFEGHDDDHYKHFITWLCFSACCTKDTVTELEYLQNGLESHWSVLYPLSTI